MADMTLKAVLLGDDRSMSKSFTGAAKSAEKSSKGIKGHLGGLAKGLKGDFSGLTSSLIGGISSIGPYGAAAGAALAGVTAIAATAGKIGSDSIDTFKSVAGEVLKLNRVMGGSVQFSSQMRFAFKETGVDADTAAKALGILSKNLVNMAPKQKTVTQHVQVATGEWRKQTTIVKDAAGHFQKLEKMVPVTKMQSLTKTVSVANPVLAKLGLHAYNANGSLRPMADLLPEIADKFASMPNGAEKSAMALKLFGKGGLALLPFLNKGAKGLQELQKKSNEFGLTLSGKDLDALKKSRQAHKDWDAAMEGAKVQIGAQLLPIMTKLVMYFQTKMIPIIVKASKWIHDHGDQIQSTAKVIGVAVLFMAKKFGDWVSSVVTGAKAIAAGISWLWNSVLKPTITFILGAFAALTTAIGKTLIALSHIPGFGWAKTAGQAMLNAAAAARQLAKDINAIPPNKTVTVNTFFKVHGTPNAGSTKGGGNGVKGYASGTSSATAGWHWVGENGPELINMAGGETVLNARDSARAAASGGGNVYISVNGATIGTPDVIAAQIEQALARLKRSRGGRLAFA